MVAPIRRKVSSCLISLRCFISNCVQGTGLAIGLYFSCQLRSFSSQNKTSGCSHGMVYPHVHSSFPLSAVLFVLMKSPVMDVPCTWSVIWRNTPRRTRCLPLLCASRVVLVTHFPFS
ncbi:hypothetical protein D3C81_1545300 [compost metagenome]